MRLVARFAGLLLALGLGSAHALPVVGGTTSVKLTAAPVLTSAGVTASTLGSATSSPGSDGLPIFYFAVTGGELDTATFAGTIEHEGSGLSLSRGGSTIDLENFVIDTVSMLVYGDVSFSGSTFDDVELFSIGLSGVVFEPFKLSLTTAGALALSAVLGLPNLSGAAIGNANTVPITIVPEPTTYALLLAGVALMVWLSSRRRSAAAPLIRATA